MSGREVVVVFVCMLSEMFFNLFLKFEIDL